MKLVFYMHQNNLKLALQNFKSILEYNTNVDVFSNIMVCLVKLRSYNEASIW